MVINIAHHTKDGTVVELTIKTNDAAHSLFSDNPELKESIVNFISSAIYFHLNPVRREDGKENTN